ncbi:MAG: type II toxin-antitoxin system HicA family toxin [Clostridia bacterium]|nr:type II toxin-antitoxin system HicA family toxin [Clostridia bacterium]
MSQFDKAVERLRSCPKDYTYDEASSLLSKMGFAIDNKGKTSGSRVCFFRNSDGKKICLHKPHPGSIMKLYAIKELIIFLEGIGEI